MDQDFFAMLQGLNNAPREREDYILAPMCYVGAKSRSINQILPHLPYTDTWVEGFGGTGVITLNRRPSKFEVFNDRHAGIVAFYRCIRDSKLLDELLLRLNLILHSREEYIWSKATWELNELDVVERAARWYYTVEYSFGGVGRNFGRSITSNTIFSGKLFEKLQLFYPIHERFKKVQIENLDWRQVLKDYDSHETVFYLDPPYYGKTTYKHELTKADHIELCKLIFDCKGFVALSGYYNEVYPKFPWDRVETWKAHVSVTTKAVNTDTSNVTRIGSDEAIEHLYIKEFEE